MFRNFGIGVAFLTVCAGTLYLTVNFGWLAPFEFFGKVLLLRIATAAPFIVLLAAIYFATVFFANREGLKRGFLTVKKEVAFKFSVHLLAALLLTPMFIIAVMKASRWDLPVCIVMTLLFLTVLSAWVSVFGTIYGTLKQMRQSFQLEEATLQPQQLRLPQG